MAQDAPGPSSKKVDYSPYPKETFPNQVFFGDTHLHTSYSTDAGMIGNTLGPEEAYHFARGETVTSSTGVPMGGDLTQASAGKAPVFMVQALRDPDGANLDRLRIIKGWLDAAGKTHERIWDVAVSDGRTIGPDGRCQQPVGNTVNVAEATYTNAIGDAVLGGYWRDPEFDRSQRAFYYVRVLEIPTPRWTTYDAKVFGVKRPEDVPASIQERAYTSPIWYTPRN